MTRIYRKHRQFAPPLDEIVRLRMLGDPMEEIADTYGCHRRTIDGAADRAARRGHLAPVRSPVIFPEDLGAQDRLAAIVGEAHRTGIDVWGWEHIARARASWQTRRPRSLVEVTRQMPYIKAHAL